MSQLEDAAAIAHEERVRETGAVVRNYVPRA
jgi:hypothetical protein